MSKIQISIQFLVLFFWLYDISVCTKISREDGLELCLGISELDKTDIRSLESSSSFDWFQPMDPHQEKFSHKRHKIDTSYSGMQGSDPIQCSNKKAFQDVQIYGHQHDVALRRWSSKTNSDLELHGGEQRQAIGSDTCKANTSAPMKHKEKVSSYSVIDYYTTSPNFDLNQVFDESDKRPSYTKTSPENKISNHLFSFDLNRPENKNEAVAQNSGETEVVPDRNEEHRPDASDSNKPQSPDSILKSSSEKKTYNHLASFDLNHPEEANGVVAQGPGKPEVFTTFNGEHRPGVSNTSQSSDSILHSDTPHREFDIVSDSLNSQRQTHTSQSADAIFSPPATNMPGDREYNMGVDMQKFEEHSPITICSSAAVHFTEELVAFINNRYFYRRRTRVQMINEGQSIWTFEILLPHVYFLLTLNPSYFLWERIKKITGYVCKAYQLWALEPENNTQLEDENVSRFLLWHTDVMYQACRNRTIFKSIEGGGDATFRDLMSKKMSSLPRMLQLIYDRVESRKYFHYAGKRSFLRAHFSTTWKSDLIGGYPDSRLISSQDEPVSKIWMKKSKDIMEVGETVPWPTTLYDSEEKPLLLVSGDVGADIMNESKPELREFMTKWKLQFESMISSTLSHRISNEIPVSDLECYGLGFDHFISSYSTRSHPDSGLSSLVEYNVKLFANFLLHDFSVRKPGIGIRQDFWQMFKKKLLNDYGKSIRRSKKRKC